MLSGQAKVEFQKANFSQLGTNGLFKTAELIYSKLSVVITYQYFEKNSLLQLVLHLLSIKCLLTNPKVRIVAMFVTVSLQILIFHNICWHVDDLHAH